MQRLVTDAYLLHSRPYKESSALLTIFSRSKGKITCMAKGLKKPKSRLSSARQLFKELTVEVSVPKKEEGLHQLISAELLLAVPLRPRLYTIELSLHYMNELIYILLPQSAHDEGIYELYQYIVEYIDEENSEHLMRRFEIQLLEALGYGVQFDVDDTGVEIDANKKYFIQPMMAPSVALTEKGKFVLGEPLQVIAKGPESWGVLELKVLKYIMRLNINAILNGRTLNSRKLFAEYLALNKVK